MLISCGSLLWMWFAIVLLWFVLFWFVCLYFVDLRFGLRLALYVAAVLLVLGGCVLWF